MQVDKIPCFIVSEIGNKIVSFDVEIPETISDSYSANYANQATKGRSNPFKAYNNSGPRSVSFTVTASLDYRRDLVEVVDVLREMLKPADVGYILAPRVTVRIGDILNISAVPTSFNVAWRGGYKENKYRIADLSFGFDQVEDKGTFQTQNNREYQSTDAISVIMASYISGKSYDLGGSRQKTGLNGSTISDLAPGTDVVFEKIFNGYEFGDDCQEQNTEWSEIIPTGTYTIYSRYKDCIRVKYKAKYYWINPFRGG